jgi:tetratricopeptide (TPR) repeat protein
VSARAAFLLLLLLGGCASGAGLYRAGQQAHARGDLEEARRAFEEAAQTEPKNAQYRRAYEEVTREIASALEAQANTAEQNRDWIGASRTWAKAAELAPANEEYSVRRDLTLLKSQNLDPDGWYRGVNEVAKRHPKHEIVQRTLEKAQKQAYMFRVGLAKRELGLRHYQKAVDHLDEAMRIDPEHPGLTQADLNRARALAVVEEGDALLAKDNPVSAAERYQSAYELMPSASIKR